MREQHIIEDQVRAESCPSQGSIVPLDLPSFQIVSQSQLPDGSLEVHVRAATDRASCPRCQTVCVKVHDTRQRAKRDSALRDYRVRLIIAKRRFRCLVCRRAFTEPDSICGRYRRTTTRFREQVAKLATGQPIAHVAKLAEVGPRFVQECLESWIQEHFVLLGRSLSETTKLPTPSFLGIDEFARRKGHCYDTIVCDLEARTVVEVSEGRKLEEVQQLLERFDEPDAVKVVSMDMSASFRPAVQLCLPKAQIVVDHFHVIQHVMKAFRKVLSSWAHKQEGKPLLQGKQHLFLLAQEDLSPAQEQERSSIATQLPVLEAAWKLKEALRTWYATATATTAAEQLDGWMEQVRAGEFAPLTKALSAFVNWRQEILAFFHWLPMRLSNGFVGGKNNRPKAIMRQGYGYRNRQHLRLRILWGNA